METNYKRTVAGSVGAGLGAVFNGSGRQYYILEHKTESLYHHAGESQKIIVDQIELGRDSACQVRFDESFETVSRRHAAIVKEGENWKIIPLSQTNPTFVNGTPIQGDTVLKTGDEIRLSSKGPLMGFIIPQGKQSLVSSIGMTERLSLFRQQALRPYKRAIWTLAIILLLAVAGLVTWNILQAKKFDKELQSKQEQIMQVQDELNQSGEQIDALNQELIEAKDKSEAEQAAVQQKLQAAQARQRELVKAAEDLNKGMQDAIDQAVKAGKDADRAKAQASELQNQLEEIKDKNESLFKTQEEKSEGLFGKKK
jgi:hypothetical protein